MKSKYSKKRAKIKKPKKKKKITQRAINSLGEYHQTTRRPIKLGDFMRELKIDENEEEADDKLLPTEICRVISDDFESTGEYPDATMADSEENTLLNKYESDEGLTSQTNFQEVNNIKELVIFYVHPHRKKGGPGRLFYKGGEHKEEVNRDWFYRLVDSGELIPTRMPSMGSIFLHSSSLKPEWAYEFIDIYPFAKPAKARSKGKKACKSPDKSVETNKLIFN
ncbi:hypothetical protein M5K25_007027 [Dendrobium thyrsiflorum]|uniref:Uncharacterized protein n=1 Tax=Dendrobium thyrsiflorum TaxID=117978 RepID=A0ABD0VE65_DENTH